MGIHRQKGKVSRWWWLLFVLALCFVSPVPTERTSAQSDAEEDLWRGRLAAHSGRSELALGDIEIAPFTLLDGRALMRVKAVDRETGEILGGVFEGDRLVDEAALRAVAGVQWRAEHGALTPETAIYLSGLPPEGQVDLALWLAVDLTELPRPEVAPGREAGETFQSSPLAPPGSTVVPGIDDKPPAVPLSPEDIPEGLLPQLRNEALEVAAALPGQSKSEAEARGGDSAPIPPVEGISEAEYEVYQAESRAHLQTQLAPVVESVRGRVAELGLPDAIFSFDAPLVYLPGVTRAQAEMLARWPEIDAVYVVPERAGPSLSNARPTQNANLIENVGYDGAGSNVAVVEGERAFFANPFLTLVAAFDGSRPYATHPTGVAGIIRSTHSSDRGLAPGSSVYSANGDYGNWGVMSNAIDWGSTQAHILNNSWYWDASNSAVFWAADRHLDYIVRYNADFVAVASGNFGNGCGGNFSSYVVSPAKGYNVMSVGNYNDQNTLTWTDDVMNICSSFGNPGSDSATPTREKPEVAAVGTTIDSTVISTDPATAIGPIGSGTSYASPMVAALAADMMQANTGLRTAPEAVKAVIMATALHNIEGSARLSDVDGVGAINASAALASVERGHWDSRFVDSATTFPLNYSQHAYAGERVRFVITWSSNPTVDYTSDPLPADLDLRAYRADGTTLIQTSLSSANSFEIVDFIAPATEVYRFTISRFGSWAGSGTYLGVGWWRGTYRISPEAGYSDPMASPLGTHLSVYPTSWSPTNYWRAMGIRSNSSDHDLVLSTASWFDDPSTRNSLTGSYYSSAVDYILVDGNHRSSSLPEHYRVNRFSGSGGYNVGWSNPGVAIISPGIYGPYTLSSAQVLKVFDVRFYGSRGRQITALPVGSSADLALELFRSSSSVSSTWTRGRGQGVRRADAYGTGPASERLSYMQPTGSVNDWLGLVIYNKVSSPVTFYLYVENLDVYLPLVLR